LFVVRIAWKLLRRFERLEKRPTMYHVAMREDVGWKDRAWEDGK